LTLASRAVSPAVRALLGLICRIDARELGKVPGRGPLIIAVNHINFLEVPLLYSYLHPRGIVGLVKSETWDNRLLGALAAIWEAIPIDRGENDVGALKKTLAALEAGRIVAVAPEGTRSGHGRLQKGHGGIIQLAARSGAPILPVVHFGGEAFWKNLAQPRRTRVTFRVGRPCRLDLPQGGLTKSLRSEAADELMRRLALLLPERYRGAYADSCGLAPRILVDIPG
jgi:1-acyl-sn-glycerol-3-phosphate acyltransferase